MINLPIKYIFIQYKCLSVALAISLQNTSGLTVENNTTAVLVCKVNSQYPSWSGPPLSAHGSLTTYNYLDSPTFNPALGQDRLQRMSLADNNRDLVLNPVTRADEGNYECFHDRVIFVFKLNVRGICMLCMCLCSSFLPCLIK